MHACVKACPGVQIWQTQAAHSVDKYDSTKTTGDRRPAHLTCGPAWAIAVTQEETKTVTPTKHPLHCTQRLSIAEDLKERHIFHAITRAPPPLVPGNC